MKRKIVIPVVVCILLIGFLVSIPLVNDISALNVEKELIEIALPNRTEIVDSLHQAAKLVGNGNGMQYFGAILIKSELSQEELSAYYSEKLPGSVVKEQKSQSIECIDHRNLSFETAISDAEGYYIVYHFGSGIPLYSDLDLRGH